VSAADGALALVVESEEPETRRHLPVVDDRGRPRRTGARATTVSMRRMSKGALARGAAEYPPMEFAHLKRPETRADCEGHVGPCPWVRCKWHLYLSVNEDNGNIKLNFPDLEVWELPETCALDVADREGMTLEEVGAIMNLTRERIRQLEVIAFRRLKMDPRALHIARDEFAIASDRGERPSGDDGSGERTDADAVRGLSELSYGQSHEWGMP